jgi:hypothetical protein
MSTIEALEKHPCAACGAQAEWDPAAQVLRCPYCGTVSPYEVDTETGRIRENDLVRTLRELGDDERGWQTPRQSVQCRSCHAVSVFDPARVGQRCEFCGSPELINYEEIKAPIRPQALLPFKIGENDVRQRVREWIKERWFAPGRLRSGALIDRISGLYIPYWTFDAQVHCPWTAEAGHYYYTTESYRDDKGNVKTRQLRQVRWVPATGTVDQFFDDEPVPGTQGIRIDLLRTIEPFPTGELVPYDTSYLSGFVVEHYQVVLVDAARSARESMEAKLRQSCAGQVPGDTQRNLQIFPEFSGQTFKHVLVPVWLLNYDFGSRKFQVIINGYTGKVGGDYPKSAWKIALLILTIITILGTIALLSQ